MYCSKSSCCSCARAVCICLFVCLFSDGRLFAFFFFPCFFSGDIIFNARDPELPPDFIFGEDAEFLPEPSELPVCLSQLKCLQAFLHTFISTRIENMKRCITGAVKQHLQQANPGMSEEISYFQTWNIYSGK